MKMLSLISEACLCIALLLLCTHVNSVNISGTTDSARFPCHCANESACIVERSDDFNGCSSGGCGGWNTTYRLRSGTGCQRGDVTYGKGGGAQQSGSNANVAARAVDDDLEGYSTAELEGDDLYWSIDLGDEYVVEFIRVRQYMSADNDREDRDIVVYSGISDSFSEDEACRPYVSSSPGIAYCANINRIIRYVRIERAVGTSALQIINVYAVGYLYYKCNDPYEGKYYWGPACLRKCYENCDHQCNVITGRCMTCDHCSVPCTLEDGGCHGACDDYHKKHWDVCKPCESLNRWGRQCENRCNCEDCDITTGRCDSNCYSGYMHDVERRCVRCERGYWGVNCAYDCHCSDRCDTYDGHCDGICDDGFFKSVEGVCKRCYNNYWGDRCQHLCHCRSSCSDEDGYCFHGCDAGYGNGEDGEGPCIECDDGLWSRDCQYTCNCRDNDVCDKETGACPNGCPDWVVYTTYRGCNHLLPKMRDQYIDVVLEHSNGVYIQIQFTQCAGEQSGTNGVSEYSVEYRVQGGNEWIRGARTVHLQYDRNLTQTFSLPEYRQFYQIRVVPYEGDVNNSLSGEPTRTLTVNTDCRNGRWGEECEYNCGCDAHNVICDKRYGGACDRCVAGYIGRRCDILLPIVEGNVTASIIERELLVNYDISPHAEFTVDYIIQVRINGTSAWGNYTTQSQNKHAVQNFMAVINTLYDVRVIPLIPSGDKTYEGVISDVVAVPSDCIDDPAESMSPGSCSHWCECDIQMCLLITDFCNSVCNDDNNECDYPLPDNNTDIFIQPDIEHVMITVSKADHVGRYEIHVAGDNSHNITAFPDKNITISGLQPASKYVVKVVPVLSVQDIDYYGMFIYRSFVTEQDGTTAKSKTIIIIILVVVLILVSIVFVVCVALAKYGKIRLLYNHIQRESVPAGESNKPENECGITESSNKADLYENVNPMEDEDVYYINLSHSRENAETHDGAFCSIKLTLDEFSSHYSTAGSALNMLPSEFSKIHHQAKYPCQVAELPENISKHWQENIKAFDHNRVVLNQQRHDPHSDYINASYIPDYTGEHKRAYVACQGPLPATISDMWRMIWQLKSNVVVMLTNLTKQDKTVCSKYWLSAGKQVFNDVAVEEVNRAQCKGYMHRTFSISVNGRRRKITQLQFVEWTSDDVPESISDYLQFYQAVKSLEATHTGPLVVHCDSGIGRTGTFIALDHLMSQARAEDCVDIIRIVRTLRNYRMDMVDTQQQYRCIYAVLNEALPSLKSPAQGIYMDLNKDTDEGATEGCVDYTELQDINKTSDGRAEQEPYYNMRIQTKQL